MTLKHIFHLSDIHIRNGDVQLSRYDEYSTVFTNLQNSIKNNIHTLNLNQNEFLIIVTGDIFHNKNIIGNYGLDLYKQLITILTSLGRTIIFHGNHDKCQDIVNQPSLLSSTPNIPNLTILTDTRSFVIDDIGFSYVSIDDTLDTLRTSGRINQLPPFPQIKEPVNSKIALFHGTFANVKLNNGTKTTNMSTYPFEWIKDFDFAILGDIHLRQSGTYHNTLWGYAGSLIQQNYGEDLINHGYMIWDLHSKSIATVNVPNKYGLANIKESLIQHRNKYVPLIPFIETHLSHFPSTLEIKVQSSINIKALITILNSYNISFTITNNNRIQSEIDSHSPTYNLARTSTHAYNIIIDDVKLLDYFHKSLSEQQYNIFSNIIKNNDALLFDISQYPSELTQECHRKNKEISTFIQTTIKSADATPKTQPFYINYLEWENLYCYENKNWIDFDIAKNSTFLISGNNGVGKSAIYDIITLAIWGDITPQKQNSLKSIINTSHSDAYALIDISLNDTVYRIHRKFHRNTKSKNNINVYHLVDNTFVLLKQDNASTQHIINLFGTMEDFLAASMVTQNMDMNLLTMNYKDTLSYIDKATNIDYIYNLYNLFKSSINKYKDFRKIIESKKQVYEGILKTSKHTNAQHTKEQKEDLQRLKYKRDTLYSEINTIPIDVNDPTNQAILATDYDQHIHHLPDIQSDDDYNKLKDTHSELKILFKNDTEISIESYANQYNDAIQSTFDNISKIPIKPCEYQFIQSEELSLQKYATIILSEEANHCILDLANKLETLNSQHTAIHNIVRELSLNRPPSSSPKMTYKSLLNHTTAIFQSLDKLLEYCNTNNRITPTPISIDTITYDTYDTYTSYQRETQALIDSISKDHSTISSIDDTITILYNRQQDIYKSCPTSTMTKTYQELSEDLSKYSESDITSLEEQISEDITILDTYYQDYNKIQAEENILQLRKQELASFNKNEEYEYNPCCHICCKRPWVARIKQLNELIASQQSQINEQYQTLFDNTPIDYLTVFTRLEANQSKLATYNHLKEWHDYLYYKETTESIGNLLKEKETLNKTISTNQHKIADLTTAINAFNAKAYELYDAYQDILTYKTYSKWKNDYDTYNNQLEDLNVQIASTTDQQTYLVDIKPRIDKLNKLKRTYKKWQNYNKIKKIIDAHNLLRIAKQLDAYEKYKSYEHTKSLKPLIAKKIELSTSITELDTSIADLANSIASQKAHQEYYTANVNNHKLLEDAMQSIDSTIQLMQTIIDKFKEFRKEIYNTIILKNLASKTNELLATLCHKNTKQFQLDYMITETKDILHINWLIKNSDEDSIISINQASGFQRFAISLAIRMTLFQQHRYQQLFIDEGFTACDKQNLSVVPAFLKSLLNHFNSIVIVSHIDVIQDSTETKAEIHYNPKTFASGIQYGTKYTQ